jgi:outer membrane protein insertion porin family
LIAGNKNITGEAIRAILKQKVGQPFSPTDAESDRQAIQDMGYFSAVTLRTTVAPVTNQVSETYTLVENPRVTAIVFTGNSVESSPVLLKVMQTQTGQVLNTNLLSKDIQSIIAVYRNAGFRASISDEINIDPATGTLTVPLIEARISSLTITGNKKTKTWVITREMKSKPGQVYNENVFRRDLTKIYNLGLFDNVGPADIGTPDVGKVALTLPVTEKRTGQVSVGVGYSSTEHLVGRAQLSESNFRGLGETASIMWEVGSVQSESSIDLGFADPWIDRKHDGFSVDLYDKVVYRFDNSFFSGSSVGTSSQYVERHKGAQVSLSRPLSDYTTGFLTVRGESVSTNNADVPVSSLFILQNDSIFGLGGRIVTDTRDNAFNAAAGGYTAFSLEGVGADTSTAGNAPSPLAPGPYYFPKFGADLRRYFSLQGKRRKSLTENKRVFAVRLLAGFTATDTPFSEQYFLGGADTLRGYAEDRFWGNDMLLINAEVRIPIVSSVQGVLFTDAGDAWGSIYQAEGLQQATSFQLQAAVGVGLRVTTPVGPIKVDYGIGRFGGNTDFSVGQSF